MQMSRTRTNRIETYNSDRAEGFEKIREIKPKKNWVRLAR